MFHVPLPIDQIDRILGAPGAVFQCARWVRGFHRGDFAHIGWSDHGPHTDIDTLLAKYGFLRVPRFELNAVRLLLATYGPLLIRGAFAHASHDEASVPIPEMPLVRVTRFRDDRHAIVVNGYWDGPIPRILYRDPAHPRTQFVCDLGKLRSRLDATGAFFYLNCMTSPCAHLKREPAKSESVR